MNSFTVDLNEVYALLPVGVKKPADVTENGRSGVNQYTYNEYELQYNAYINSELRKNNIPVTYYVDSTQVHPLLRGAQVYLIAAAISRKWDNAQNPYKDLYATGNIFLRQYIDEYKAIAGTYLSAPEWAYDEENVDIEEFQFPTLPN